MYQTLHKWRNKEMMMMMMTSVQH